MATYSEIQEWIQHRHGVSIKTCWIAQVKKKCGLEVRVAVNRIDGNVRQYPCPENKRAFIKKALRHFGMI